MPALELRDIVKRYGESVAVNRISLSVEKAECVALLGPSGCGKTTLLRMVAGLLSPDDGSILLDGVEVASRNRSLPPEQRNLAMVFQHYALWPHKTVLENVAYGLRLRKVPAHEVRERALDALETAQMGKYHARYPAELSGGQQQRVSVARAIALQPSLLLFDEPLSNLDAALREEMRFELKSLQQKFGFTSLYVTHDQQEAMVMGDRVVLMRDGVLHQQGAPWEIYSLPASRFAANFVGTANLVEGTVEERDGEAMLIRTALGQAPFRVAVNGAKPDLIKGRSVYLVFRPEAAELSASPTGEENWFQGQVVEQVFLGSIRELKVQVGQSHLRVQVPGYERRFMPGDQVYLEVRPDRAWAVSE